MTITETREISEAEELSDSTETDHVVVVDALVEDSTEVSLAAKNVRRTDSLQQNDEKTSVETRKEMLEDGLKATVLENLI